MSVPLAPPERLAFLREHLLESVAPFWTRHAWDRESGVLRTCIEDDGTVLSDDIYMWSQLRAIWTFSALYDRIETRPEWLEVARGLVAFCSRHGRDDSGRWCYRLDPQGNVLEGATSLYADGFAIYGLSEYYRVTGDRQALDLALETFRIAQARLAVPGSYTTAPYTIPEGAKAHGVSMIFSIVLNDLARVSGDADVEAAALDHAQQILSDFLRDETGLVHEYVQLDGEPLDSPLGRAVVPGHAIESMWFLILIGPSGFRVGSPYIL